MATVQPIKDMKVLEKFKSEAMKSSYRNFMLVVFQLNTGLRIGDIVGLTVNDVKGTHISIQEEKTNKFKRFPISHIRKELDAYIKSMDDNDYLFPSRQKNANNIKSHITTTQAYRALVKIAESLGIKDFATHSLRKTFGYFYYQKTGDLVKLMDIFNHSSLKITKIYIGLNQEEIDESLKDFHL